MDLLSEFLVIIVMVVLGYVGGEIVSKINLPKVLGFLLVGMLIGPFALGLIDASVLDSKLMSIFLLAAIGFVGYSVGEGIHIDELKKTGSKTMIIGLLEAYTPFVLVTVTSYIFFDIDIMTSLVIGSIALATAPAMALSISQEYKTDGPVTKTLMPIVAIDDVLAVATFGVIIAFADAFYSGVEISVIKPFIEILVSIGWGAIAGFISYYLIRNMKGKTAEFLAALLIMIVTMLVAIIIHAELFMVGIAYGMILINMLNKSEAKKYKQSTQKFVGIAMIVFMVLIGMTLDISAMLAITAIAGALVYMIARAGGKIGGARLGATLTKSPETVKKYLGFTLLPAAGISLTFVGLATPVLPDDYAVIVGTIIAAAAIINELIAVGAIKWAFEKAGEMGKAT